MADTPSFNRRDLRSPDAFFEAAGRLNRYLGQNRRPVIVAALTAAVLLVGGLATMGYVSASKARDAAAFERARSALETESFAAARIGLDNLAKDGGGIYGDLGAFYAAGLALSEGRLEEAVSAYEAFEARAPTEYLRQAAITSRGHALEQADRAHEALAAYGRAGDIDGPFRRPALLAKARLAESLAEADMATEALERLLELYPGGPDSSALSARLSALSGG